MGTLRAAVAEFSWLLTRGYALDSGLKLVGDRYALTVRQRTAVRRSACSDQALGRRSDRCVTLAGDEGCSLGIDGYNLLITVESALSGGVILVGRDGCFRDLASVHGTYRKVAETMPAVELIADHLAGLRPSRIDWFLDRPVSNSGRLKALMAQALERRGPLAPDGGTWNIELVNSPDKVLADYAGTVATSDSGILDRCGRWTNLAADIVESHIPNAWCLDLRS